MRVDSLPSNATVGLIAVSFPLLLSVCACGASRAPSGHSTIIHWDKQGGTLALKGDDAKAREQAKARMKAYCKGSYRVVNIDRVKVGEATTYSGTTKSRDNTQPADSVVPDRSITKEQQVTTVTNVYETQVTYVCTEPEPFEAPQIETEPPKKSR